MSCDMEIKTFLKRLNDKDNKLSRKEFVICYFVWWVICILALSIIDIVFEPKSIRGIAIGLSFGFFSIFAQRLQFLGLNKWWALLAFPLITNPILFVFLIIKNKRTD